MDEDTERYLRLAQREKEDAQLKLMQLQNEYGQMSSFGNKEEINSMETQLDLTEVLDNIHHLLQGHILTRNKEGNLVWEEPFDDRLKILSDYGVKRVMNDILFYLNKNTLLSNYTEEVITWKVKDLGIELSDLLFNCYESYFYYPTAEELFDKAKTVKDPCNISDYDLYMKCVQWSHEELQSKLRHYPLLVMNIVNAVHSAYLRALGGQERKSFRENFHNFNQPQDKSQVRKEVQLMKPSTW